MNAAIIAAVLLLLLIPAAALAALQQRRLNVTRAELRRRETELLRATRLATLGELSASIVHEITQPLGAILANAAAAELLLAQRQLPLDELRRILADIRADESRAHAVIQRLRALLERRELEGAEIDLHAALADVSKILAGAARQRQIRIVLRPRAQRCTVLGDQIQMQQLMLNLLINAMDAMGETPPALRTVEVDTCDGPRGIELRVSDRGHGFAAEQSEALFASFFTTKNGGMGLGLSIARAIVRAHRGSIAAAPRPGGGAVFTVLLPRRAPLRPPLSCDPAARPRAPLPTRSVAAA